MSLYRALIRGTSLACSSPKRIGSALNISEDQRAQVHVARSFRDALQWLDSKDDIETVYAIGGVAIYAEAMALDACDKLYVTHVRKQFTADRFLPPIEASRWRITSSRRREDAGGIEIDVNVYERVVAPVPPPLVHEEEQYLNLIREVRLCTTRHRHKSLIVRCMFN